MKKEPEVRKISVVNTARDFLLVSAGVISASIGLKVFLLPNKFLDGGAMGISLLMEILTGVDLSILIVLINLPFIVIGSQQISKAFAIKTAAAIIALAILVHFIQIPAVTDDKLLIAGFGGFFLGLGIGFAIRGSAVIDGTEVMAIYISRRTSLTVGDCITLFNIVIFTFSAWLVNIETAMYSMLTYFTASKTVDFIINGIDEYIGVTIVSLKPEEVRDAIVKNLGRGVTVYKAESGFGKYGDIGEDRKVIFCVVTRLEVTKLLTEIDHVDEDAFVIQHPIKDTKGGMIKKRPLH